MPKTAIPIFIVLICLLLFNSAAHSSVSYEDFLNQGKENFNRSDYSQALQNFARAYLTNPQDRTAENFIKRLNDVKGLKANEQIFLLNFTQALDYLEDLAQKKEYYQNQKKNLESILLSSGISQEGIDLRLTEQMPINIDNLISKSDETDSLKAVQAFLIARKAELTRDLDQVAMECRILTDLRQGNHAESLLQRRLSQERLASSVRLNKAVLDAQEVSASRAGSVNKELAGSFEWQVDELKKSLLDDQKKIKALSDQVVDITLQMAEKDVSMLEYSEMTNQKDKKINELKAQIALSQEILSVKNSQISKLTRQIGDNQNLGFQVREISGMLEIYRAKLSETNAKLDQKIAVLDRIEEQYNELKMQLFAKDTALVKTRGQLAFLQQEMEEMKREMRDLKMQLSLGKKESIISRPNRSLEAQLISVNHFIRNYHPSGDNPSE